MPTGPDCAELGPRFLSAWSVAHFCLCSSLGLLREAPFGEVWSFPWVFRVGPRLKASFFFLPFRNLFDIVFLSSWRGNVAEATRAEAPKFDGSGGLFADYEEKVLLWKRAPAT